MDYEQIKEIVNSDAFIPVREFIYNKCEELRDISNVQEYETDKAQALELKAQKKAYFKLYEILGQIMDWEAIAGRQNAQKTGKSNDFGV